MFAIVKFKDNPFPTIMAVQSSGHVFDLSTMARVEWVCAGYVSSDGTMVGRKDFSREGALGDIIIAPFLPHSDPPGYHANLGGDLVRSRIQA